jgi:hypothetical protein
MFAVRTAGQRSHNQVELALMLQKWGAQVEHALFEFGTHDPEKPVSPDAFKTTLRAERAAAKSAAPTPVDPAVTLDEERLKQAVDPPLSWHLTELQKQNVEEEWNVQKRGSPAQAVQQFLA